MTGISPLFCQIGCPDCSFLVQSHSWHSHLPVWLLSTSFELSPSWFSVLLLAWSAIQRSSILPSPIFDPFHPPVLYMGQRWWLPVSGKWNCSQQYVHKKRTYQTQSGQIIQPQSMCHFLRRWLSRMKPHHQFLEGVLILLYFWSLPNVFDWEIYLFSM